MKTFNKILLGLAALAALFACSEQKAEYKSFNTVQFSGSSYNVNEDTVQFVIPVSLLSAPASDITVTVKVVEGSTATAGTDFTIENEVISFVAGGEKTKDVIVDVIEHEGVFTNTLNFRLAIDNVVGDGVYIGTNDVVRISIKDNDHPLTAILGDYAIDGVLFNNGSAYKLSAAGYAEVTFSTDPDDVTKVWIGPLSPIYTWYATGEGEFYGIVSKDMKTITIPFGQTSTADYGDGAGPVPVAILETVYTSGVGIDFVEPKEGDAIVLTLDETASGKVYVTTNDWDVWDVKDGVPTYYNAPVLGNKWAPLFGLDTFRTVFTKK